MPKPGRRTSSPSEEIARFTNRENQQAVFRRLLSSAQEPPVLMYYGTGGAGKSWLLNKLRTQVPDSIPSAYLNFDALAGGQKFVLDPAIALHSIQTQLSVSTPRFELAIAMLRHKQGIAEEPGLFIDVAAEVVGTFIPGGGTVLKLLSKHVHSRLKGTALERLLDSVGGTRLVVELRKKTDQEIGNQLLQLLAQDLREAFPAQLNRAVSCVIFLDTFEALGASLQNNEHKRQQEKWVQDLASEFNFALLVIAGQNRLTWDDVDPNWSDSECLDQHLVGGLAESDARHFLINCDISSTALQDCILSTSRETTGGFHCFSLGLCADIVISERNAGREPEAETLRFNPQDWAKLARRFLKSLPTDKAVRWIEKLALTPKFDELAARRAFSSGESVEHDVVWNSLHHYSFVERISGSDGWSAVRSQMRTALENQPLAKARLAQDHQWWENYWSSRSQTMADDDAGNLEKAINHLAWYHHYYLDPSGAMKIWNDLAESARTSVPARMREHSSLLDWLEPLGLLERNPLTEIQAKALFEWGVELTSGSLNRESSLHKAIACYEVALSYYTENEFQQDWARAQGGLGSAWIDMPTGDRTANLEKAINHYEAALRVLTEQQFPRDWASVQTGLGCAWIGMPTGDRAANLEKGINHFEAALCFYTEKEFPQDWAMVQNNLAATWIGMLTGDRAANLEKAINHYEAALRVYTEKEFPQDWARVQNNLAAAWNNMRTGDRTANLEKAINHYEAALRVYTEKEFPRDWANAQDGLGSAWIDMRTGDRTANLEKAINHYEAALRVLTEQQFPRDWARVQYNLGAVWYCLPTNDSTANLEKATACFEAALRVFTEQQFPEDWARVQYRLGAVWHCLPTNDRTANLEKATACFEAALRMFTEQQFPEDWALSQTGLGCAWIGMPTGDRTANLMKAIACFEAALRIYTEQDFPEDWARVQTNLGNAWSDLPTGDRAINDSHAIACYEAALRVYTEAGFPRDYDSVTNELSKLLNRSGR
jgi:tetratricopeptide (TPR) repeat protein